MTPLTQKILDEAAHLSPIDRAELVERIIESFDDDSDDEIKKAWAAEAERRLADYKHDVGELVSEDEAFYRIDKNKK